MTKITSRQNGANCGEKWHTVCNITTLCVELYNTLCVITHTVYRITQCAYNYTLCVKVHIECIITHCLCVKLHTMCGIKTTFMITQRCVAFSMEKKFLSLEKFYTNIVSGVSDYYEVCEQPNENLPHRKTVKEWDLL